MVTPNQLSQPRVPEISQMQKLYPDQKDVGAPGSISLNSLSSVTTPAAQPPLLQFPPSSQQVHWSCPSLYIYVYSVCMCVQITGQVSFTSGFC